MGRKGLQTHRDSRSARKDKLCSILARFYATNAADRNGDRLCTFPNHANCSVMAERALRPPVGLESLLFLVWTLIDMPGIELMSVRPSAPSASKALPISATLTGAILTRMGQLCQRTNCLHNLCSLVWSTTEGLTALLKIWTTHVKLNS